MIEFVHDLSRRPQPEPLAATPAPRWRTLALLLGLALVVYLPAALRAQFLGFDDNLFFGPDNPEFRSGLAAVFDPTQPIANAFLPVAHASLWFDWWWFGGSPFGPHLVSLVLHGLAGYTLVRALLGLGLPSLVAHLASALFVVHPALAESAAWVSGRKDVLSGLFVFFALQQTAAYARRPGTLRALGLAALTLLAMYAKATAVVLPLLAALVSLYVGGPRRRWAAPLVILLVTLPIAWHHQQIAAGEGTLAAAATGERLLQVPGAFLHYLGTAFWPQRLNVLYPEIDTLAHFRAALLPGAIALGLTLLVVAATARLSRWRGVALGAAGFGVALLPFNTAYPASSIAAADRYLYLALPFASLLLVAAAAAIAPRRGPWFAAALLAPLAWLGGSRAHDFQDDRTLWQQSLAVEPQNAVAHLNLVADLFRRDPAAIAGVEPHLAAAVAAARYPVHAFRALRLWTDLKLAQGDYGAAADHARAAIAAALSQRERETSPKRQAEADALVLQARLAAFEPLRLAGDAPGFAEVLAAATTAAPAHPDVIAARALLDLQALAPELQQKIQAGLPPLLADDDARAAAAETALQAALAKYPQRAGLWYALAEWQRVRDRVLPALQAYRRATEADARFVQAWIGAARLLREREQFAEAEKYARHGLLRREDPTLRQELALALVGQVRLDDAELELEAYLRARPGDKDTARVLANVLVGRAYARLSQPDSATEVLRLVERARFYNPDEKKVHLVLGRLAFEQRQFAVAVEQLELAAKYLPGVDDVRLQLASALAGLGYERLLRRDDDGVIAAFERCLEVAPRDFATDDVRQQLWNQCEARGVAHLKAGRRAEAAADFRRCLALRPDQHWESWLLATSIHQDADVDLTELERLCRAALAWQRQHDLDASQQVLLLARTLLRRGDASAARRLAAEYLEAPSADAKAPVLAELRRLAVD